MSTFDLIKSFLMLKINEKKSRKGILRLREKKFRKILKFAYKHSKFYNSLYKSNGITETDLDTINIKDLPIVDKDILMDNFDNLLTTDDVTKHEILDFLENSKNPNELFKNKYHVIHTSGTSAKLGIFIYSKKDWDSFFPFITRAFDFKFNKYKSACLCAADGHYVVISSSAWTAKGLTRFFCKTLTLEIKNPLKNHIKKLNEFQPDILGGYFTGIKFLAEKQEIGELDIYPKFLVSCGEAVVSEDKKYIERIFNLPLINLYGVAECVLLGVGKKEYDGIYLMDDIAFVEIMQDHILLTNLFNKTQPIIRYRINDYLTEKQDSANKLPFTLVNNIVGREEAIVWLENDKGKMDFIHPLVINDFYVKGLDKLQIVIKNRKSFDFLAVLNTKNKKEVTRRIKKELDGLLLRKDFTNVKYSVKVVDDIAIDKKTGKYKLVVINEN